MEGFELYRDAIGSGIAEASYIVSGLIDFYSEQDSDFGRYCIDWIGVRQYAGHFIRLLAPVLG